MDRLIVPLIVIVAAAVALLAGVWTMAIGVSAARERRAERARRRARRRRSKIDLSRPGGGDSPAIPSSRRRQSQFSRMFANLLFTDSG